MLTVVLIWPIFAIVFLFCNRKKLEDRRFKRRFTSMYSGIKVKGRFPLTYTSVFCLRRLFIVCIFLMLDNHKYWLLIAINGLQSVYLEYMAKVRPHEENIHNRLEYINEVLLIAIQYMMLITLLAKEVNPEIRWVTGYVVAGLIALIFLINIAVLVYMNLLKIKAFLRMRRLKKQVAAALDKQTTTGSHMMIIDQAKDDISIDCQPVETSQQVVNLSKDDSFYQEYEKVLKPKIPLPFHDIESPQITEEGSHSKIILSSRRALDTDLFSLPPGTV